MGSQLKTDLDYALLNCIYPIVDLRQSTNGKVLEVKRKSLLQGRQKESTRGEIKELSRKSRNKLAAICLGTQVEFKSIITLTYHAIPEDGKKVKSDLNYILNYFRRNTEMEYLWFLEFQKRGAPHFHILSSIAYDKEMHTKMGEIWTKRQYKRLNTDNAIACLRFNTAQTRGKVRGIWEDVRKEDGARRYALKYALKTYQKHVPEGYRNVGRFWGHSKAVAIQWEDWQETEESEVKAFLHDNRPDIENWEFYPQYIYTNT